MGRGRELPPLRRERGKAAGGRPGIPDGAALEQGDRGPMAHTGDRSTSVSAGVPGLWLSAFASAEAALAAARFDLPPDELRDRRRRLKDERAATLGLLDALACDPRWARTVDPVSASTGSDAAWQVSPTNVTPCGSGASASGSAPSPSRPRPRHVPPLARSRSSASTRSGTRRGSARASRSRTAPSS